MANPAPIVVQAPPMWPQADELFTGRVRVTLAAAVVYRYYRITHAVWTYGTRCATEVDLPLMRRRWRLGLHHEVVRYSHISRML